MGKFKIWNLGKSGKPGIRLPDGFVDGVIIIQDGNEQFALSSYLSFQLKME